LKIEIALLDNAPAPLETPGSRQDVDTPWGERRRVKLKVTDEDSFGLIADRAVGEFQASNSEEIAAFEAGFHLGFHRAGDETAKQAYRCPEVPVVQPDGRAFWKRDFRVARYGDLLEASRLGLFPGDPRRVYLIRDAPYAGGPAPDWAALLSGVAVLHELLASKARAEGSIAFGDELRVRVDHARSSLKAASPALEERGARPASFRDSLGSGPWTVADLTALLGIPDDQVDGLLTAFGFAAVDGGLWHPRADAESELLSDLHSEIELCYAGEGARSPEKRLRERLRKYLASGKRPALPEDVEPAQHRIRSREDELVVGAGNGSSDLAAQMTPNRSR